jgi:SAM-dependent methyltransferase
MLSEVQDRIFAIKDWRHPYVIGGQPVALAKARYAEWHPWRWSIDLPILTEAIGGFAGRTVLDIGCNDGCYGFEAEQLGATVLGVDGRAEAIERAELLKAAMGRKNISFLCADIERPATLGEFDVTLFYGILYHLADPIQVLARMGEATKRIIAVQTFAHVSDKEPRLYLRTEQDIERPGAALQHLVARPSQPAVIAMLRAAGFDHVYQAQPKNRPRRKDHEWVWSFFYGVKGSPLTSLRPISETTVP